jgi:hypothetical protein
MTVKELIQELTLFNPELEVVVKTQVDEDNPLTWYIDDTEGSRCLEKHLVIINVS